MIKVYTKGYIAAIMLSGKILEAILLNSERRVNVFTALSHPFIETPSRAVKTKTKPNMEEAF